MPVGIMAPLDVATSHVICDDRIADRSGVRAALEICRSILSGIAMALKLWRLKTRLLRTLGRGLAFVNYQLRSNPELLEPS